MTLTIDQHVDVEFGLQCVLCKHRDPGYRAGCVAFPDGIPLAIVRDEFDHSLPYPGDRGIRYEPLDPDSVAASQKEAMAGAV